MSDALKRIEQEPLYPCCQCYDEYSWNKEDLRWYKNDLWCANCFDELDEDGERMLWIDLEPFVPKCDRELAEARAENARLAKTMQLAIAINLAMQESSYDMPDLRGHECLAKHKLLSLFDLWRKKVRPRLPGFVDDEISQRDKLIEQMKDALQWYKEQASSCNRNGDAGELARDRLAKDVGKRAEAALSAAERGGK